MQDGTHASQNGFVRKRQLLQNVVDLDSFARIFSTMAYCHNRDPANAHKMRIAILAFFDFASAFPSIAHAWIMIVLRAAKAPEWLINYITALYSQNHTYRMSSFGKTFLYSIFCGVIQGCPMSATIFLFAVSPSLVHFDQSLARSQGGIVRACADDIGICLKNYSSLKNMHIVFGFASELALLTLKPSKCVIVPLNPLNPLEEDGERERELAYMIG